MSDANPGEVTGIFSGITDMQEMNSQVCYDAKMGDTKQLIDSRDGKSYWVAKLKDSNCWMVQNLDYDGGGTKISAVSGWTDTSNSFQAYYDPGMVGVNGSAVSDSHLLVGNYCSWQAAISDVCPYGWKLPSAGLDPSGSSTTQVGQFANLLNNVSAADIVKAPYYFIYGGYVGSGELYAAGSDGFYWSSTARDGSRAYYLYFNSSGVSPSFNDYRYYGFSVRCLVQGS